MKQSRADKLADARIDRAFRARCANVPINMMDITKVFKVGKASIEAGDNDRVLADKIAAFVETIRVKAGA